MNLHIGLDGSRIAKTHYTGTEHYSHAIFEALFRVAPHHRYTIYAPARSTHPLNTGNANVNWRIIPFPRLWTQLRLSLEFTTHKQPDVLFIPSHTVPLIHPRATVATVHDLGFRHFPEYYGAVERWYQELGLRQAVRAATRIIAISETTKRDLLRWTAYPADRITVVHHGVNRDRFHPPTHGEEPTAKQQTSQPYLYSIGRLEVKKNTPKLIRAFRILKEKYRLPHRLVLAGKPGTHGYAEVESALIELPDELRNQVLLLGYVSDDDNAQWLRFADCLVFTSAFEGFGMPALEAMASDTPVVVSNSSSLPEIVGDAGMVVNHTRSEAIAEAVMKLVTNKTFRAKLISQGRKRMTQFSWERAGSATVAVLEAAACNVDHSRRNDHAD